MALVVALVVALVAALAALLPDTRPVTPRTVWTYWHSALQPRIVRRCVRNWRTVGGCADVRATNALTIHRYIPWGTLRSFDSITKCEAHKSDLIRFHLLHTRGGIWMHASVFCNRTLDWLPDGFFCYRADRFSKEGVVCLENFFIKSPRGHPFLKAWMDQTIREFKDPEYKATNERYRRIIGVNGDYLVPYVASMKLEKPAAGITLRSAEEGPYLDTVREDWNPRRVCRSISRTQSLVKLYSGTRRACPPGVVPLRGGDATLKT